MREDSDFCSLELGSGEATGVSEGRGGRMKEALQGRTEQSLPKQAGGGKVRTGEWEKGVCEQIKPPFVAFLC